MKKINLFNLKTKCKLRSNPSECFSIDSNAIILRARWLIFIYFIFMSIAATESLRRGNLLTPQTYNPLNGDLNVQLQYFSQKKTKHLPNDPTLSINFNGNDAVLDGGDDDDDDDDADHFTKTTSSPKSFAAQNDDDDVRLQVSRYIGTNRTTVAIIDVYPDPRSNITQISVSCLNFLYGGIYELEIVGGNDVNVNAHTLDNHDERLHQQLDVRWPQPKLTVTPESIGTYPEQAIDVILEFPGIECIAPHIQIDNIPEFWLELFYCGHDVYCDSANVSNSQVLYAEQVRGYPKARLFKLSCELFGLAGHYVVKLRGIAPVSPTVTATAFIKADWSEQFVFNVHARSISPCDPHTGIGVLFEYPACILDRADRIRLFGKLRADVVSLAPPTSLHYITEQRVVRGQHALHFDCDFFSEKFVEYCFVYVSQAISGAVADVRMDCLPTLPVRENDLNAGWSEWSSWTPCSTTCAGGTRNRYRVCDNPPPRYGARFCEGSSVETQECGGSISDSWDCIYGATGTILPSDFVERPEIKANTGSDCRCGCIIHLTLTKPRRIIAASAQSCPGRTFWLIQADSNHRIRFHFDFFRLICSDQYVRIRDGDSLAAELVGEFIGGMAKNSDPIVSASSKLLLEFYSNELSTMGESCKGAFLTHAQQIKTMPTNVTVPRLSKATNIISIPTYNRITMVHVIAILFSGLIIVTSALLLAQYVCRYRKYQLAGSVSEDSPAHTPRASIGSLGADQLPSRAVSTTTLFSEVVSFIKARPRGRWMKHARLRESVDGEALENALQAKRTLSDDTTSLESTHTLTNETCNGSNDACELSDVQMATKRINKNHKQDNCSANDVDNSNEALSQHLSTSPSSNSYDGSGDDTDIKQHDSDNNNDGTTENGTSFKQHRQPSKPKNCNSISLPRTPADTPRPIRRNALNKTRTPIDARRNNNLVANVELSIETTMPRKEDENITNNSNKSSGSDDALTDTKSVNGKMTSKKKKQNHLNVVDASNERITNAKSRRSDAMRRISVSNATLRNSCYSPASSIISVSTNRSTNIKESKEKKNREKLLAGPGSEFSLANPDMEMDYYDYNVTNAAAVPGSYLGMDPAYLVYIPPLEDDDDDDDDDDEHEYDESDASDESETQNPHKIDIISEQNNRNRQFVAKHFNSTEDDSDCHSKDDDKLSVSSLIIGNLVKKSTPNNSIQMIEINRSNNVPQHSVTLKKFDQIARCSYASDDKDVGNEKETTVIKSPSNNFKEYYELDDIQFVDDDDEDDDEIIQVFNGKQNNFDASKTHGQDENKQNVLEIH